MSSRTSTYNMPRQLQVLASLHKKRRPWPGNDPGDTCMALIALVDRNPSANQLLLQRNPAELRHSSPDCVRTTNVGTTHG